ncbi:hypothetical protein [Janthinobacterium violaceinigrum]|uniref:Uncharacterized protein n=1 Tax=Janthinobacterium violaceinigrum TaxID=2654252 RepID=A0A6I1I3Q0_9BURK|nr:hypothetical protein [Janthinobacterium violaceinigrum]KAB8064560.1 hypothetical protein GCN75_12875 [Janthinobacterium violaceinigrum]
MNNIFKKLLQFFSTPKGKQWRHIASYLIVFLILIIPVSFSIPPQWRTSFIFFQTRIFLFFTAIAACGIIFPRTRQAALFCIRKIQDSDKILNQSQRLYRNVTLLGIGIFALSLIGGNNSATPLAWIFLSFCIIVALYDAYRWYRSMSEHAVGKAALGLGFAAASTLAYAIARQEIADIIHVTPINFTHTTLLMAILMIPTLLVLSGGLIYITCMVASLLVVPFLLLARNLPPEIKEWLFADIFKSNPIKYPLITKFFQFFFYGTLGLLIMRTGGIALPHYESTIQKLIPSTIYHLDMYHGQECKLQSGEKLAPLGDSKFLIGKPVVGVETEIFQIIKCDDIPAH